MSSLSLQLRVIKDRDFELASCPAGEFDAVGEIAGHLGNGAAKDRVVEVFRQRNPTFAVVERLENQRRFTWQLPIKPRQHHQPAAALDAGVARSDRHAAILQAKERSARRGRDAQSEQRGQETDQGQPMPA